MFGLPKKPKQKVTKKSGQSMGKRPDGSRTSAAGVQGENLRNQAVSQSLAGDALRAQALANAKAAREHLGDETIQKIAHIMAQKKNNPTERAKRDIASADAERVAMEILLMLETRH